MALVSFNPDMSSWNDSNTLICRLIKESDFVKINLSIVAECELLPVTSKSDLCS